jgi:ribosomal protein S18 acetylase RimI-like enzyme
VPAGEARERLMHLFLLADDSEQEIRGYLQQGELYACVEADRCIGIILAIDCAGAVTALKAVAIEPGRQGQGHGKRMMKAVLDDLRSRGTRRAVVGTASAAIGPLAFYQKAGFRMLRIERDYFTGARGYPAVIRENGIAVRDMVWLDRSL